MPSVAFNRNRRFKNEDLSRVTYYGGKTYVVGKDISAEHAEEAVRTSIARYVDGAPKLERASVELDDKSYEPQEAAAIEPAPKKKAAKKKAAKKKAPKAED